MRTDPAANKQPAENPNLNAVLRYRERGWRLFPTWPIRDGVCTCEAGAKCRHPGKHPLSKLAPNGFKSATNKEATLRRWWTEYPDAGIGIRTGKKSGIIVIDVDRKDGKVDGPASLLPLYQQLGPLPKTKMAATPSNGIHYYFRYADGIGSKNGELGKGLDVKGDGGYIVAPPSHGLYKWLDKGPVEDLPPAWVKKLRSLFAPSGKPGKDREADPKLVAKAVAVIPNDASVTRDQWISIGMAIHAATNGSDDAFRIFDEWSQKWPHYNADDTRTAWAGFKPKEIGAGTLFHLADQADPNWRANASQPKQAVILARIAREAQEQGKGLLFHNAEGVAYTDLEINGHRETWPIRSQAFKKWLARAYYERHQNAPSSEAVSSALNLVEAWAQFDGDECEVFTRVGPYRQKGKYYIDLCNADWQAIEIDKDGWRIVDRPPVRFIRRRGMLALPIPVPGGSVKTLRSYINVKTKADFKLVVAWVLGAFRERGPYPVLVIMGRAGTAKSTAIAVLRKLIDPNTTAFGRAPPRENRDLFIAAANSYVVAFDNLSSLPDWLSDTLARLAGPIGRWRRKREGASGRLVIMRYRLHRSKLTNRG